MDNLIKILFVQSNPLDTSRLRADKEFREIYQIARSSISKMEIEKISATRVKDLVEILMRYKPNILHFSGHGTESGIIMEDDNGNARELNNEDLCFLLKTFRGKISCVFLNSCYSVNQAQKISEYIPFVIGVDSEISDDYAILFATIFYRALPLGTTIVDCYNYATAANIMEDTRHKTQLLINSSLKEVAESYSMMMQQEKLAHYKRELSNIIQRFLIAKDVRTLDELLYRSEQLSRQFEETFELSEIKEQIKKAIRYHIDRNTNATGPPPQSINNENTAINNKNILQRYSNLFTNIKYAILVILICIFLTLIFWYIIYT